MEPVITSKLSRGQKLVFYIQHQTFSYVSPTKLLLNNFQPHYAALKIFTTYAGNMLAPGLPNVSSKVPCGHKYKAKDVFSIARGQI